MSDEPRKTLSQHPPGDMLKLVEKLARHLAGGEQDCDDPAQNLFHIGDDGRNYEAGVPRWHAHRLEAIEILDLIFGVGW